MTSGHDIRAFIEELGAAVKRRDSALLLEAAEFPHTVILASGAHVFATPNDLRGFLDATLTQGPDFIRYDTNVRDVRAFGEDLFLVEYHVDKERAGLGPYDGRRQFSVVRQVGEGFRVITCYMAIDALPTPSQNGWEQAA